MNFYSQLAMVRNTVNILNLASDLKQKLLNNYLFFNSTMVSFLQPGTQNYGVVCVTNHP